MSLTYVSGLPTYATWEWCDKHQIYRRAAHECPLCAIVRLTIPDDTGLLCRRDVLGVLEARIADLEAYVGQLRTQVVELQRYHRGIDDPRA